MNSYPSRIFQENQCALFVKALSQITEDIILAATTQYLGKKKED